MNEKNTIEVLIKNGIWLIGYDEFNKVYPEGLPLMKLFFSNIDKMPIK